MSVFELTARNQMYLGNGNIVRKGETFTMNIHTLGAQPYNVFSNPENRRQAIQQFGVNGIDAKKGSPVLNVGNWDVKKLPDKSFHRAIEGTEGQIEKFHFPWQEIRNKDVIDDVDMKKGCIDRVASFFNEGKDLDFAEKGLEDRCDIAHQFYDGIKQEMGIDAKLSFDSTMSPKELGGFNPNTNTIRLNAKYLEDSDCTELMDTIVHESRHAYQKRCVDYPNLTTVSDKVLDAWEENFDKYVSPEDDFVAYENQEIEKDANYFASTVMRDGVNKSNYA